MARARSTQSLRPPSHCPEVNERLNKDNPTAHTRCIFYDPLPREIRFIQTAANFRYSSTPPLTIQTFILAARLRCRFLSVSQPRRNARLRGLKLYQFHSTSPLEEKKTPVLFSSFAENESDSGRWNLPFCGAFPTLWSECPTPLAHSYYYYVPPHFRMVDTILLGVRSAYSCLPTALVHSSASKPPYISSPLHFQRLKICTGAERLSLEAVEVCEFPDHFVGGFNVCGLSRARGPESCRRSLLTTPEIQALQ